MNLSNLTGLRDGLKPNIWDIESKVEVDVPAVQEHVFSRPLQSRVSNKGTAQATIASLGGKNPSVMQGLQSNSNYLLS